MQNAPKANAPNWGSRTGRIALEGCGDGAVADVELQANKRRIPQKLTRLVGSVGLTAPPWETTTMP